MFRIYIHCLIDLLRHKRNLMHCYISKKYFHRKLHYWLVRSLLV
jgi:hypothetical protein